MKNRAHLILCLVLLSWTCFAAENQSPSRATTALKAAAMLDPATGKLIPHPVVLINGERIQSVGTGLSIPPGASIIDLGEATILPGLIDCHTHMTTSYRFLLYGGPMQDAVRAPGYAKKTLEAGITTVRDLWAKDYTDVALRDAINAGEVVGPRMLVATLAIGSTGGHNEDVLGLSPTISFNDELGIADGVDAVRKLVRTEIKNGADVIKIMATEGGGEGNNLAVETQFTLGEMQAIVEEAHRYGKKVAAHAHGTDGIKVAIRADVDSIEHGTLIDAEAIRMMKEKGTYLVPTGYIWDYSPPGSESQDSNQSPVMRERNLRFRNGSQSGFRSAVQAGVKIAMGSDSSVIPHGENPKEIIWMATHGMTALQAIRAATVSAADLLGWSDRVGSISTGKYADIIAVKGNPADNVKLLEHVPFVMKGGAVIKNEIVSH